MNNGIDIAYEEYITVTKNEYERFTMEEKYPIIGKNGSLMWLDKKGFYHREDGPAIIFDDRNSVSREAYYIHGFRYNSKEQWKKHIFKTIIFSRKNKNTLKKILYIPELYQSVFYDNKELFISLLQKL